MSPKQKDVACVSCWTPTSTNGTNAGGEEVQKVSRDRDEGTLVKVCGHTPERKEA